MLNAKSRLEGTSKWALHFQNENFKKEWTLDTLVKYF